MNIGTFTKTEDGYTGTIRTLTVNAKARRTSLAHHPSAIRAELVRCAPR